MSSLPCMLAMITTSSPAGCPATCIANDGFDCAVRDAPRGKALAEDGVDLAGVQEWDRLNVLALGKFKYYLHDTIYKIVWKGHNLTALEFYKCLHHMFLRET